MHIRCCITMLLLIVTPVFAQDPLTAGRAAYAEAERARLATPSQRQEAIRKYEEAIEFYRAAGERAGERLALTNIGVVYNQLGEKQKALEYLNQALPWCAGAGIFQGGVATLQSAW